MAKYSAEQLRQMASNGQAMKDGSYPIADAEDLQNAIHAVGRGGADHDAIRAHIIKRAKAMGKSSMIPDNWGSDGSLKSGGRAEAPSWGPYTRSFALEDISIRSGGDGRVVDAYAAVFNSPATVRDQDGEYEEVIDPTAFNRAISHAQRKGGGWNVPVIYNHGMTMWSTPSERHSVPIGVPLEIRADSRGVFTSTRYHRSQLADEVLEAIREGSVTAQSYSGVFKRSEPLVPRGGFRSNRGALTTVRRMESTLREYGPTPFPVYADAAIVGVRAEQVAVMLGHLDAGERHRLAGILTSGTPTEDPPEDGTPNLGPAAGDPPAGHSTRTNLQQLRANSARFIVRYHGGLSA